jgi:hypothetical protein
MRKRKGQYVMLNLFQHLLRTTKYDETLKRVQGDKITLLGILIWLKHLNGGEDE